MGSWVPSKVTSAELARLANLGWLPGLTAAEEWIVPSAEHRVPEPPPGYIVSFTAFHERGFNVPADDFLRRALAHWGLELQHLTPNGVLHMAAFVMACEGWLGKEPNWALFQHLFFIKIQKIAGKTPAPIGCAMVQFRQGMAADFPKATTPTSIAGWRERWFYLRNDETRPLPVFTGRIFEKAKPVWRGRPDGDMVASVDRATRKLRGLRDLGLTEPLIVASWLGRGLVPLQRRELRVFEMVTEHSPFRGTVTARALSTDEIELHVAEVTGASFQFPEDPTSWPHALPSAGTRNMVSFFSVSAYRSSPSSFISSCEF